MLSPILQYPSTVFFAASTCLTAWLIQQTEIVNAELFALARVRSARLIVGSRPLRSLAGRVEVL